MDPNQKPAYPGQAYEHQHPAQGYEQPPPYFASQQQQQPAGMQQQQPAGPGWNPAMQHQNQGFIPAPGQTVIVQPITTPVNRVVLVGGCPNCRAGLLEDSFGCCAIFLAIFFFPIGILCCLAMREKRCTNCGQTF